MPLISYFQNDETAYHLAEKIRWPIKPVCPHCDAMGSSGKLRGATTHPSTWKCYECRKPFNVRLHTLFEGSHAPLHVWFQLIYILLANDMKISTGYIERTLIITYKMARHMKEVLIEHDMVHFTEIDADQNNRENQIDNSIIFNYKQEQADWVTWHSNRVTKLRFDQFNEVIAEKCRNNVDALFLSNLVKFLNTDYVQRKSRNMHIISHVDKGRVASVL